MISALISFLGGSIFRTLWGEVSAWISKKLEHSQEIERLKLQGDLDAAQHARNLEAIRVQAELGVKTIQVQSEAALTQIEAEGWLEAVKATARPTGIKWVDAWNAVIRPSVATWAVVMMTLAEVGVFVMSENATAVASAALGIYLADRALLKRGK